MDFIFSKLGRGRGKKMKSGNFNILTIFVSNLIVILNKLDFHNFNKQSHQPPKCLFNKYGMTIKVKTSNNPRKFR